MPPKDFKCKKCGQRCLNLLDAFTTCATDEDFEMWEIGGRNDSLNWVDTIQLVTAAPMIAGLSSSIYSSYD